MFGFFTFEATVEVTTNEGAKVVAKTLKGRVCLNPLEVKTVREIPQPAGSREGYCQVIHETGEYVTETLYPTLTERWRKASEERFRLMRGDNGQIA